jgi:hypothetical protein
MEVKMIIALNVVTALAVSAAAMQVAPTGQATDSRGYTVTSNPAEVPAGANRTDPNAPAVDPAQVFAPRPSPGDYPACTREVTDNCKQIHERQRTRRGG